MLYHGTVIGGLQCISANSLSHTTGMPAAYFTSDRCYALICCRDAQHNFDTRGNTWESTQAVPVSRCKVITDVYEEILKEEAYGSLVIHRYSEIDPAEQQMHANYIRDHLDMQGEEMKDFFITHFHGLWD